MTSNARPFDRPNEWVVLFRVFVLAPAIVTLLAVAASALFSNGHEAVSEDALELGPAESTLSLGDPSYGAVLTDVVSATDAVEALQGWVLLDRRAQQLVMLDQQGGLVGVAARRGDGPGELSDAARIALVDSTLVVVDAGGNRLDLFTLQGAFRERVPLRSPAACAAAPVRDLIGQSGPLAMLRLCTRTNGSTAALVERVSLSGDRESLVDTVFNDLSRGIDPTRIPLLASVAGSVRFVITPERCVIVLGQSEDVPRSTCHPDADPLLVPDSLKASFKDVESRVRAMGGTLKIPDRFPPFDRLLTVGDQLAFHVILDDSTHALEVVRGERLERIQLPNRTSFWVGTRTILLAQDRLEGTAFAVLPLP